MIVVVGGAVGVVLAGPLGGLIGCLAPIAHHRWSRRPEPDPEPSLVIMLILIELRSGMSILAALESASHSLPRDQSLRAVARVARVSGLLAALPYADTRLHPVVSQLARAQRSGASLTNTMRQLLESNLAAEKTTRVTRARTLPVRLMLPVTLLMLPGLVLFLYAPSLLAMFSDLTGVLS